MDINICIVDDNVEDIKKISELLLPYFSNDNIQIKTFTDSSTVDFNVENDLYILDIDIPNKDGYHVANDIYNHLPTAKIIFCTMHDDFVFSSFQFNPFYFIRKSHLEDDMKYAMRKFKSVFQNKYLFYKENGVETKILLTKVIYMESSRNYVIFHTINGKTIKVRSSIINIQSSLNDNFIKISNGIIINVEYTKAMNSKTAILTNGISFPISRSCKDIALYKYNKYFMET